MLFNLLSSHTKSLTYISYSFTNDMPHSYLISGSLGDRYHLDSLDRSILRVVWHQRNQKNNMIGMNFDVLKQSD